MRSIAHARNRLNWLQRWWCKKYNRPSKDPLLLEYTIEELAIEFFQDRIDEDLTEAAPRNATVKLHTGDAVADAWEEQIVKTGTFDPTRNLTTSDKEKLATFLKLVAQKRGAGPILGGSAPKPAPVPPSDDAAEPRDFDPDEWPGDIPPEGIHEKFGEDE